MLLQVICKFSRLCNSITTFAVFNFKNQFLPCAPGENDYRLYKCKFYHDSGAELMWHTNLVIKAHKQITVEGGGIVFFCRSCTVAREHLPSDGLLTKNL